MIVVLRELPIASTTAVAETVAASVATAVTDVPSPRVAVPTAPLRSSVIFAFAHRDLVSRSGLESSPLIWSNVPSSRTGLTLVHLKIVIDHMSHTITLLTVTLLTLSVASVERRSTTRARMFAALSGSHPRDFFSCLTEDVPESSHVHFPVEPKPPAPRSVCWTSLTSANSTAVFSVLARTA